MMKKYELDDIEKLFCLSQELIDNPNEDSLATTFSMLECLSDLENERDISGIKNVRTTRGHSHGEEIVISETPIAITAEDAEGYMVTITLEVEMMPEGLQLVGELLTDLKSSWTDYTVLISQDDIIEDFTEVQQGEDFSLALKIHKQTTLKFISSTHEVILLKDIKIKHG